MSSTQKLKVLKVVGHPIFRNFESRYSIGVMRYHTFNKHDVICAEIDGEFVEIVGYRLSAEEKEKHKIILQD